MIIVGEYYSMLGNREGGSLLLLLLLTFGRASNLAEMIVFWQDLKGSQDKSRGEGTRKELLICTVQAEKTIFTTRIAVRKGQLLQITHHL